MITIAVPLSLKEDGPLTPIMSISNGLAQLAPQPGIFRLYLGSAGHSAPPPSDLPPLPRTNRIGHGLFRGSRLFFRCGDAVLIFASGHHVAICSKGEPSNSRSTLPANGFFVNGMPLWKCICNYMLVLLSTYRGGACLRRSLVYFSLVRR